MLKQPNHKAGKPPVSQGVVNRVLKLVQTQRPEAATHWSTREIAKRGGHAGFSFQSADQSPAARSTGLLRYRPLNEIQRKRPLIPTYRTVVG